MLEPRGRFSIKRRLLFGLLLTTVLAWGLALTFSYREARQELNELLDAYLAQSTSLLIAQLGHEADEIEMEHAPALHRYSRNVVFQVWARGEALRLHSAAAPNQKLSHVLEGFSDTTVASEQWRVFSTWDAKHEFLVQVGERRAVRDKLAREIAEHLLSPLLMTLPVLALLIWLGVSRGLRPLAALSQQVAARDPNQLSPLSGSAVPVEVAPLVQALDDLFARIKTLLEHERQFTADAAHELRTPLAAIKIQAQVARAAIGETERLRALDQVLVGCDRAAHLVAQLLTLARLEPGQLNRKERCELHHLAANVIAEITPAALAKNIDVDLIKGPAISISGDPDLLQILLRNLMDNAVRYSPSGSTVQVSVSTNEGKAEVSVIDQGPGIPATARSRVWERFHRVLGSGEEGSGLGLSIVQRIAELHGAQTALAEGETDQGLRVTVTFPLDH